jgi:hypothetical protein
MGNRAWAQLLKTRPVQPFYLKVKQNAPFVSGEGRPKKFSTACFANYSPLFY